MKANRLGIANLKRTMQHLEEWVDNGDDENYALLRSMYRAVEGRYYTYLGHVLRNIGGAFTDVALRSEQKSNYVPVSKAQQQAAVAYLCEWMLKEPVWLYPQDIKAKTRFNFYTDVAGPYDDLIGRLVSRYFFIDRNRVLGSDTGYSPVTFIHDLYQAIFGHLKNDKPISQYDRFIQATFVSKLLLHAGNRAVPDDVNMEMIKCLDSIAAAARLGAAVNKNQLSIAHLRGLADLIDIWKTGTRNAYLK
jgi:hypothetical protein